MNYCTVCGNETRYITCPTCKKNEQEYLDSHICLSSGDMNKLRSGTYTFDIDQVLVKEHIDYVLDTLTYREEKLIKLRFGLNGGRAHSLDETGREFNITRNRVCQIEAKALRKLRHPSRYKRIKGFFGVADWTEKEMTTFLEKRAKEVVEEVKRAEKIEENQGQYPTWEQVTSVLRKRIDIEKAELAKNMSGGASNEIQ